MPRRIDIADNELILMVAKKNKVVIEHLTYDRISRIQFSPCKELRWLVIPQPSEAITITPSGKEPIVYKRLANKRFFDEYKTQLAAYAKKHRISFQDSTKGG